jgi:hypothetical protein
MNMPNGPSVPYSAGRLELWRRARHEELCGGHRGDGEGAIGQPGVLEGPGFLYRPRQVLFQTGTEQTQRVERRLQLEGGVPDDDLSQKVDRRLPVQRYLMPPEVNIPRLVAQLRDSLVDGEPAPNVGPNHVFCGEPSDYHGGPYGEPLSASPFPEPPFVTPAEGTPWIAVLDTGYDLSVPSVPALHPGLINRVVYPAGETEDPLTSAGYLAQEAGHGLFIDGILMQLAPQVPVRQIRVLCPAGDTDDLCVAQAITYQADAAVINLSLGGYAYQDVAPVASGLALAGLDPTVAVVAAAGNNSSNRLFWPAAFNRVVGVGALDTTNGQQTLACFSNYGDWVDVYAPGVNVYSTYLDATWKLPTDATGWPIDGWAYWNGTSFAAPQVAAAIAESMLQSGGTAVQAAAAVVNAPTATWVPGAGNWPGGWGYIPQSGVIGAPGSGVWPDGWGCIPPPPGVIG